MALIKPEQLRSGSYNITGSFSGSFYGDGSNLNNLPIPYIDTGSFVTTSSFNNFTSSYYTDSSSFEGRVTDLENFSSSLDASFVSEVEFSAFTSSYNTGSFSGSFTGDLIGNADSATSASYALTASYVENAQTASYVENAQTASYVELAQTASYVETAQTASYYDETDPVFTAVSGTFTTTASFNSFTASYYIDSASIVTEFEGLAEADEQTIELDTINNVIRLKETVAAPGSGTRTFEGNIIVTGSLNVLDSITGSLNGTASWAENALTASYIENAVSASYAITASYIENAQTASYVLQAVSASFASTASYVNTLNQDVLITGSLTVLQGATIYGSSSFMYITASQLAVSASFISVNVFEPAQRFGGLIVYDSGSSLSTASLAWDSLHNHWVYQNVSGATYTGGMLLSGPRNTGSLGDEPTLTQWFIPRSDGTDHLDDSQIYSSGSIHIVTGSLTVTQGVTGSLFGTSSWANNALTASYALQAVSSSYAATSSYSNLTINSTPIAGGTSGNILFQNAGLLLSSTNLVFNPTLGYLSVGQGTSPLARLDVRAQGSGSSNLVFRVRNNANTNDILSLYGNSTLFYTGSSIITGSLGITGSVSITQNVTASRAFISSSNGTINGSTLTVYGSGSAQPVFTVQGSQGELFSITDSLSGSLFSVNDISGLPILEVFSDNTTLIGNYSDPMLLTTAKVTQTNSGSFVMYSLPTASYDTAFFEYSVKSGSNARAGTIMAIQSGSLVNFTETTTTDFGNTSAISFTVIVTGSNIALTGSSTTGSWTIKTIVRGL